ncbi:MAG: hypothetical protein U0792_19950 [Gemmataceae bacterium]
MAIGFFLFMAGGMAVRSEPDGTWVKITVVHAAGAGVFLLGVLLAVLVMLIGGRARTS